MSPNIKWAFCFGSELSLFFYLFLSSNDTWLAQIILLTHTFLVCFINFHGYSPLLSFSCSSIRVFERWRRREIGWVDSPPRPVTREKLLDACFPAAKRNDGGEGAFVSSVAEESTPFPSPIEAWVAASHMRKVITSISERENIKIGSGDRRFHR